MANVKVDGTFTSASAVSGPRLSCPIPGVNVQYLLEQDFVIFLANFASLALDTAHPTYTDFKLVAESALQPLGGGVVKWTRTYAKTPATHYEWEQHAYPFIGITTQIGGGAYQTRTRKPESVLSMIEFDYFRLGVTVTDPITGDSVTPATPSAIPAIPAMVYVSQGTVGGALYGGISVAVDNLNLQGVALPTWPTSEIYQDMVEDALTNGWGATKTLVALYADNTLSGGPPPTGGHMAGTIDTGSTTTGGLIAAEASVLERWNANIYVRRTRWVQAQ